MKNLILLAVSFFSISLNLLSQYTSESNPIMVAVPFVKEAPDARGMGMGFTGAATSPDANSNYWNPAKFAFINDSNSTGPVNRDLGFSLTYFNGFYEWPEKDIHAYFSAYKNLGKQTVSLSFKYEKFGEITFTDNEGNVIGTGKPLEFYIDGAYSRKFSRSFSGAVAIRYIYSDLGFGEQIQGWDYNAGQSIAADLAIFYKTRIKSNSLDFSQFAAGLNISNIGAKVSYSEEDDDKDFIPTNLRLGVSYYLESGLNSFEISADLNKLLVPTSPTYKRDSSGYPIFVDGAPVIDQGKDPNVPVIKGMFQSFADAPRGFEEEIEEIYYGIGAEYWYNKVFALRMGYYHEHENKGVKKYFNIGAGGRYGAFGLDFTYLFNQNDNEFLKNSFYATLTIHLNTGS